MNGFELLIGLCIGLSLAAACGFRVFVPLLVLGIASRAGYVPQLDPSFAWIASDAALIAFGAATALEIAGYYVPWLDNLLDTVATPAAAVAGIIAMASVTGQLHPLLQGAVAIIAGGGAATAVQGLTVVTRAVSSTTTAGVGNPVVSTTEAAAAGLLAVLGVWLWWLAAIIALLLLGCVLWLLTRRRRRFARVSAPIAPAVDKCPPAAQA
jgi:hypothetical protein